MLEICWLLGPGSNWSLIGARLIHLLILLPAFCKIWLDQLLPLYFPIDHSWFEMPFEFVVMLQHFLIWCLVLWDVCFTNFNNECILVANHLWIYLFIFEFGLPCNFICFMFLNLHWTVVIVLKIDLLFVGGGCSLFIFSNICYIILPQNCGIF